MDAILFHPETSTRRALILALGTDGADGLSPGERAPLIARLLDLYEHDVDAGIHGAAEWTLRQWQQAAKVDEIDAKLKGKDGGNRRWYVNGQGQTFVRIEGPVEFGMGSPPDEPDHDPGETLHRLVIPRRFAIAAKEVSVAEYQRFLRDNPGYGVAQFILDKYSPDLSGPMISVSWFHAAAYCNWLSEQEKIPKDQWCYVYKERREFEKGMGIAADALQRKGYRLPTEAEWEYACRAGTVTSRYHGLSVELLGAYARYAGSSQEHAWRCGSLLPNDLGLFDLLGNVYEWCQDRKYDYPPGGTETPSDGIVDDTPRLVRGGAFTFLPPVCRSAHRVWNVPTDRNFILGFRPARTYD